MVRWSKADQEAQERASTSAARQCGPWRQSPRVPKLQGIGLPTVGEEDKPADQGRGCYCRPRQRQHRPFSPCGRGPDLSASGWGLRALMTAGRWGFPRCGPATPALRPLPPVGLWLELLEPRGPLISVLQAPLSVYFQERLGSLWRPWCILDFCTGLRFRRPSFGLRRES